jgi:hypothetical protein
MIGAGGTALATLWGGASFVDHRYAHTETVFEMQDDVYLVGQRLEQKILTDRYTQLQQRAWKIEDRYGLGLAIAPETVKEEYRQIKAELASLTEEMDRVNSEFKQRGAPSSRYYEKAGKY